MDEVKKQIVERLKQANNILVTVRNNPTVDLLSACIGLALVLDKMDKHAAAVFSGEVPSAIEFLKPEATIEQTPDSLRDFIIALDKSKADKLRYKVEDKVVRIFITPYKTSLSQDDLEFSQGDFNVDAVVALGAHEQQELDQAITVHGRILHDATVISINNTPNGNLGSMNWQEIGASSISEMITELIKDLHKEAFDEQIATSLLTGIVAETERFSNDRTTPRTMGLAGELMAAGANQQLVATSLQAAEQRILDQGQPIPDTAKPTSLRPATLPTPAPAKVNDDGTLEIDHDASERQAPIPEHAYEQAPPEQPATEPEVPELPKVVAPTREMLPTPGPARRTEEFDSPLQETPFTAEYEESPMPVRSYLVDRPTIPTATPKPDIPPIEPSKANPFDVPSAELPAPILRHDTPIASSAPLASQPWNMPPAAPSISTPEPPVMQPVVTPLPNMPTLVTPTGTQPSESDSQTLSQIEESVHSPHISTPQPAATSNVVDDARGQVMDALRYDAPRLQPLTSLNASPLGTDLHAHADTTSPTVSTGMGIEVDADGNLKSTAPQAAAAALSTSTSNVPLPPVPGLPSRPPSFRQQGSVTDPPPAPPPMTPPAFY